MHRIAVLSVCFLLVLSGCNAVPGGSTDYETTTTTDVTEATTESDASATETTGTAVDLPSGLTSSGVADAETLAAAHEEALAGQSYTYDRDVRIVAENGTQLGRWGHHVQVGAERLKFNYSQYGEGVSVFGYTVERLRKYTDGSVTFSNASVFQSGYRREPGRGFAANTFSSEQLLADALNASESSVETVEPNGETWYRVRAEGGSETLTAALTNGTVTVNATNITTTALVSPEGLVRNVTYEYDFERGNVSGHRTTAIEYSVIGETEVAVPAWVADAKETFANRFAPGLNESGVTDSAALADAHVAVLRNTSYTILTNMTARAPDSTLRARLNATRKVVHEPTRTYGQSDVKGENPRAVGLAGYDLEVWATENGTWYAVEQSNGTDYRKVADRLRPSAAERANRATIFVLFSALNTTVEGTETRNGTTLYRVESTGVQNPGTLASQLRVDAVENVSVTALVADSGLVYEYHLEYTATLAGNTSHVERTVRFTALGETSVERPSWYSEAANSSQEG